jgi:DNA/RNA-binding domain of Phe-tRNA-synthetase-like protein
MSDGPAFPPAVVVELDGWWLWWAVVACETDAPTASAAVRAAAETGARNALALDRLAEHPTAAAVRRLFRRAGCDPTRYRPSSEALLRRVLRGEPLPAIHPLVDVNNALSIGLVVPACVVDPARVRPPFRLRAGRAGESMLSMRGPFDLEGKPLLEDAGGPFGTPITDSERVKVTAGTRRGWLVAYLPEDVVTTERARESLAELAGAAAGVSVVAAL